MSEVALKRIFSLAMIVAVLSTSMLASVLTPTNTDDTEQTSSDQQIPFEENEKEIEKDEVDERDNEFGLVLYAIDRTYHINDALSTIGVVDKHQYSKTSLPLFLINRTLLI